MHILRLLHIFALTLIVVAGARARELQFPETKPEVAGFSAERLQRLDQTIERVVDKKELSGVVALVARHGKVVYQKSYGSQDVAGGKPMRTDTIFRIYSMSKPITGVAMMMLYEEGKWRPSDPLSRYIPEFANLKVFAGLDKDGQPIYEAPSHPPTVGELMSHTAGFTYGLFGNTPVDKMYQQDNPLAAGSLKEFIDRVATKPLLYQPGEGWVYSVSVDIQGYLVEKLSGKPFPEFLRERIFEPLGMKDTAFYVPSEKMKRLAVIYTYDTKAQALVGMPADPGVNASPALPSGGGGLYSTIGDYLRFAQMVANGGELNGVRLLAPSTIGVMRTNHVNDSVKTGKFGIGGFRVQKGTGFGYDFAVMEDPAWLGSTMGKGSYWWNGLAGTWFWIDPANDLVFIGMIQRRGGPPGAVNIEEVSRQLTYQALIEPKK